MKKGTISKLKKLADEKNDLRIYKLAMGEIDMLTFLSEYIAENNLGDLAVSGTTLARVIKMNNARRKTLVKWNRYEDNDTYKKWNQAQIDILDRYAENQLIDIIVNTESLKEQAVKDKAKANKKKSD